MADKLRRMIRRDFHHYYKIGLKGQSLLLERGLFGGGGRITDIQHSGGVLQGKFSLPLVHVGEEDGETRRHIQRVLNDLGRMFDGEVRFGETSFLEEEGRGIYPDILSISNGTRFLLQVPISISGTAQAVHQALGK